jgi:hypothetical protein
MVVPLMSSQRRLTFLNLLGGLKIFELGNCLPHSMSIYVILYTQLWLWLEVSFTVVLVRWLVPNLEGREN